MRALGSEDPAFESQFYQLLALVLTFILPEPVPLDLCNETNYTKQPCSTGSIVRIDEETFAKEPSIMPDTW